jgi:hypothetical protein
MIAIGAVGARTPAKKRRALSEKRGVTRTGRHPGSPDPRRSSISCTRSVARLGHDGHVVVEAELRGAVDAAFVITGRGFRSWPDPHPDRAPLEEEYSRLLDPGKWRIVGARADAWLHALVETGLAIVERNAMVSWRHKPRPIISRADLVVPVASGALPLTVARSRLGDVDDAGVTLGLGDPAVCMDWFPECGCDACDSGSQNDLDYFDEHMVVIVSGAFRRMSDGNRTITVFGGREWQASGSFRRGEVEAIIANPPRGWDELVGASWL